MDHANELKGILTGTGNAADEVADALRAAGVRGVRNTVRFLNPIVRYCKTRLSNPGLTLDVIQPGVLRIHFPDNQAEEFPLPLPIQQFLEKFDRGLYPDLEVSPKNVGSDLG